MLSALPTHLLDPALPEMIAVLIGSALVLVGLAIICAPILATAVRQQVKSRNTIAVAQPHPSRDAQRDWEQMAGIVETGLARIEEVTIEHARVGELIDSAEYRLNKLLADCALVMDVTLGARLQPLREFAPRPTPAPAVPVRRQLAA